VFSETKYRCLHATRKLQGFWFLLAVFVVFAVLGFVGFHEHGPGRRIVNIAPAELLRLERAPEVSKGGYEYAAPTPWLVEVDFGAGRVEVAEMPLKPRIGEAVCVVHAKSPLLGSTFEVIGYIDAMASRGKTCEPDDRVP
jgi:hypothetical protein